LMLPSAYVVQGVVALMIVGQVLQGVLQPPRAELTGVGWGGLLFRLGIAGSLPLYLIAATAGMTGAFAAPLGLVAQGIAGLWLLERARRRIYRGAAGPATGDRGSP
jgi:hypothetical protein